MLSVTKRLWSLLRVLGLTRIMPTEFFVKLQYFCWHGGWPNLSHPHDFNEKILWLKIHYRNPLLRICADKFAVREFVKSRIGGEYLNECIGVYSSVDEIDFQKLPEKFVLKATLGSSWNIICKNKSDLDIERTKKRIRKWLRTDFYQYGREWQYHGNNRRVICECYLEDKINKELRDYKLFTFNGEVKYIWVDFFAVINGEHVHCRNFYDPEWNYVPEVGISFPSRHDVLIPRPECLEDLKRLARKLGQGFPQCRVDFYVLENRRIVFGELTFTSFGGCGAIYPQRFCDELGGYINLDLQEG